MTNTGQPATTPRKHRGPGAVIARTAQQIGRERQIYMLMLPGVLYFAVFRYLPLLGNIIAFQEYSPFLGFRDSPFVGLAHFRRLFSDPDFGMALQNTVTISLLQLVFFFPMPIVLALLMSSLVNETLRRFIQSVLYLPHFLSWVIIVVLWQQILGGDGVLNQALRATGQAPLNLMSNPSTFKLLVVLQLIWKESGWGAIIFLAALANIDGSLYEAAAIDGASRWQRLRHVTLPGIRGVIVVLLILRLSRMLDTGFEQMFLQRGAVGAEAAEVLDTFSYFRGIQAGDWGFSTAVGLVKAAVGALVLVAANAAAKQLGEKGVF